MNLEILKEKFFNVYKKHDFFPICFTFPKEKMLNNYNNKEQEIAYLIPGKVSTYLYNNESDYMREYSNSKFGFTYKKGGWDCLRHLEIIAAGCLPLFIDIKECPENTLFYYPKSHLAEIISKRKDLINNDDLYFKELNNIRDYFNNFLTCDSMIKNLFYFFNINPNKVLFIDDKIPNTPDYLSNTTLIGLKSYLKKKCDVAYPCKYIYKSANINTQYLYGNGYNYTKILEEDLKCCNETEEKINDIIDNINSKNYDLIIYGSILRSESLLDIVLKNYSKEKIWGFIGEDFNYTNYSKIEKYKDKITLFVREIY